METQNYEDLFFTNDFMFCKIMTSNESICRRVIEVLLGFKVESITYLNKQEELKPDYFAHGIRLDVTAKENGKVYSVEMQTTKDSDLPKRARYYQALMDIDYLDKGRPYSELPESYIVFICMQDPFGGGLPRYTVSSHCKENADFDEKTNDKTLKMYYNTSEWQKLAKQDTDVKAFLKFLTTQKPDGELTEEIMEAVETARHNEPWRKEFFYMRELQERGRKEGYEEAQAELAAAQAQLAQRDFEIARLKAENEDLRVQLTLTAT